MRDLHMLRVVLTLDCDRCKQSYYKGAVCNDPEPFFWVSFASDLQSCAGLDGWVFEDSLSGQMVCDECAEGCAADTADAECA